MPTRLSQFDGSRDNNFNLIRFIAAVVVIYAHSYPLAMGPAHTDPVYNLLGRYMGYLAVDVFFATSGFLVTASLIRRTDFKDYARARISRIYPGLFIAVCFCVLIVGPLFTSYATLDYFSYWDTYSFLISNSLIEPLSIEYKLPGVFLDLPYPEAVNGSLWTLPYEIKAYLMLGVVALIAKRFADREKVIMRIVCAAGLVFTSLYFVNLFFGLKLLTEHVGLYSHFFLGGIIYLFRDKILLSYRWMTLCLVVLGVSMIAPLFFQAVWMLTLAYVVLCLAYLPGGPVRLFNHLGDYSYGIYIYAFPIQQIIVALIPGITILGMAALAFVLTLVPAVLSWHFVEQPILRRARRRRVVADQARAVKVVP